MNTEDDLTKILQRNAQYFTMRVSQVLPLGQQIYGRGTGIQRTHLPPR